VAEWVRQTASGICLIFGAFFFLAGTLGLLRFPDVYSRLHALTKADNLGLGLIVLGCILLSNSWPVAGKLLLVWLLVMLASTTSCQLIAQAARRMNVAPWKRGNPQ
jgi:multicomponent Na+:H+ antiporter subunit G